MNDDLEIKNNKKFKSSLLKLGFISLMVIAITIVSILLFPKIEDLYFSKIKGDYKIFCLGDSFKTVKMKASYLKKRKVIKSIWVKPKFNYYSYGFETKLNSDDIEARFAFSNNRLFKIKIVFNRGYYEIKKRKTDKKDSFLDFENSWNESINIATTEFINSTIVPTFTKIYGKPFRVEKLTDNFYKDKLISEWKINEKTVSIFVKNQNLFMSIYSPQLDTKAEETFQSFKDDFDR